MILVYKKKCKNNIEIDVDTEKEFLLKQTSDEEAKRKKVDIYINKNWNYVIGGEIVNFIFLRIDAFPIYEKNEQIEDVLYEVDLLICQEIVTVQITQEEFYDEKWLKKIKALELLVISKRSYQKLIHAIKPRLKDNFFFENIGMHKLGNKYYYAMSNCTLTSEGLQRDIKAIQRNFDFIIDENIDEERCAKRFLDYNMMNLRVFFPIHCISIIAILRYFLKEQGIPAGVVLWIGGNVGSGKTTLSVCSGDYFNRTGEWNDITKNLYSTKMKIKDVAKKLVEYQNAVLILDDIKKEKTVRNKENAKNVTDLIIRSIYSGKIEQEGIDTNEVNATAIITGEFFKEQMSTVSRILYLNIGAFVEEKDNSKSLIRLQDDKTYFADFMNFFIK